MSSFYLDKFWRRCVDKMTLKNLQNRQYLKLEVTSSFENLSTCSPDNALSFLKIVVKIG